jgi:hypothetical protein
VRAEDEPGSRVGVAPPGPLVAGAVLDDLKPAGGALAGKPLTQGVVLASPGEPVVAAGPWVAADEAQRFPHPVKTAPRLGATGGFTEGSRTPLTVHPARSVVSLSGATEQAVT